MKRIPLLLAVLLALTSVPVTAQTFDFEGTTYEVITTPATWRQARAAAASKVLGNKRGRLAVVDSQAENDAILEGLLGAGITLRQFNGLNGIFAWLGGTDNPADVAGASEGDFFWVDGRQFWEDGPENSGGDNVQARFANWGASGEEPDDLNGVQEYVAMALSPWPDQLDPELDGLLGQPGEWNDLAGFEPAPYVIEYANDVASGPGICVPDTTTLCLRDGRFEVTVQWRDRQGDTGPGIVRGFDSDESGLLFFFSRDNIELLFKLLNGCGFNDRYWAFFAATTDVEFTITVTDVQEGVVKTYNNELGNPANAVTDTNAFATCP